MRISKSFILLIVCSVQALAQNTAVQAKPLSDTDIQLLREDIQKQKTQIITDTMAFSQQEADAFWPVYKEYAAEQQAIGQKRVDVILDYAKNLDTLNDQKARDLTQRMFAIDGKMQSLREKYYPQFEKALGAKRAAKFYQVDNRLNLLINFQLASEIPLIP